MLGKFESGCKTCLAASPFFVVFESGHVASSTTTYLISIKNPSFLALVNIHFKRVEANKTTSQGKMKIDAMVDLFLL